MPHGPKIVVPLFERVILGIVPPDGKLRASQVPPVDGNAITQAEILSPAVAPVYKATLNVGGVAQIAVLDVVA